MEETIKPRNKSNQRAKTVFQDMRDQVEMSQPLSPSSTNALPDLRSFDSAKMPSSKFMSMPNIDLNYMKQEGAFEPQPTYYSPEKSNISPELSEQPSPQTSHAVLFENQTVEQPCGPAYMEPSSSVTELCQNSSPNEDSTLEFQMRRSESVDSLIVEETITETGITIDDIAHYIDGPDPVDQKWLCLYPDCKKRFGRKENIKSHVQTHLGDRQFQCPHCKKCFVRQHDLKRHAKIHSGVKPYPCLCGNSFARHDALTRHRQRGMCIGAFEGVVKKVVKRGRPRKNRPDNEERIEKSSRTRSKNKAMSQSSASEYSESSYGQSPPGDFEVLDDKPFGDFTDSVMMDASNFQFPSSSGAADYIQPVATQSAPSPSDHSIYSQQSHHSHFSNHRGSVASIASTHLPTNPPSPARSVASISRSQYNTPPELCLSSSSPAPNTRFYDASEHGDDLDLTKLAHMHMDLEQDDDMFLNTFGEDDMSRLEQDPDMLLMGGKFDDAFATALGNDQGLGMGMEMFSGNAVDDVFFGSP
jgi:regulatory protein SWI5